MESTGAAGDPLTFRALVRQHRQAAALSQEALAERAGLSVDAVSVIERGKRGAPRPDTVALLAQALELDAAQRAVFIVVARAVSAAVDSPPGQSRPGSIPTASAPMSAGARPPLPAPLTTFIGRERELAMVRERLLHPTTRLLTLTGPGGTGKTRLALEVAREVQKEVAREVQKAAAFPDGVVFVSLAALTDPVLVLPTIAHALGLPETTEHGPFGTLTIALAHRQLLLVLDNLEQVAAAAIQLVEVLAAAPGVRMLVTSRARLNVRGERVLPVQPLSVPDLELPYAVSDLLQSDAVRLFVDRARDALPDFALTERNAAQVAALCVRLDGLPLALELAAARIRVFPLAAQLRQLDNSLALLAGGPRDLPTRQQTLRATIAWSYDLLAAEQQALFRRLSVFTGGAALEAVAAVCRASEPLTWLEGDALAELVGLADQSLLEVAEEPEGDLRFHLLETTREYGWEQAGAAGETEALCRAHATYYLALAEEAERQMRGPRQAIWLARLETDYDNLRAALYWSQWRQEAVLGLRLAAILVQFWHLRGRAGEGRLWLEKFLAAPEDRDRAGLAAVRAKASNAAAWLAFQQGDYGRAEALATQGLAVWQDRGDVADVADALDTLAEVARGRGDYPRSAALHKQSLAQRRALGDAWGIIFSLINLGHVARAQGEYAHAAALYEESIVLCRTWRDTVSLGYALTGLGAVACVQGNYARAMDLHDESLLLCQEIGNEEGIAFALAHAGHVESARGHRERAGALYEQSLAMWRAYGDRWGMADILTHLAKLARAQGDDARAVSLADESLALYRELGDKPGIVGALCARAEVARAQGNHERAAALLAESLQLCGELVARLTVVSCLEGVAEVASARGYAEPTARLFGASTALRASLGAPAPIADQPIREQMIVDARVALGDEAFAVAWATGQALSLQEAIVAALELTDSMRSTS